MKIEVIDIADNLDGTCTLVLDMPHEVIYKFASITLIKAITDAAHKVVDDVDNFVKDADEHTTERFDSGVDAYIYDAIKLLDLRPQAAEDQATMIDALVETCQNAIDTLAMAKSLLHSGEDR